MKTKALAARENPKVTENRAKGSQFSGQSAAARAANCALCVGSLILMIVCVGCGSSGYNPNNVTVTVSPASVTAPENGQETLQAEISGECSGCSPLLTWSVTENFGTFCNWIDTPPAGPCPGGTLQVTEYVGSPTATYFAPSTPGAYHVVADDLVSLTLNKDGTSVITVGP
jgi:hypothetical protein